MRNLRATMGRMAAETASRRPNQKIGSENSPMTTPLKTGMATSMRSMLAKYKPSVPQMTMWLMKVSWLDSKKMVRH